jgi:hypothetical protein
MLAYILYVCLSVSGARSCENAREHEFPNAQSCQNALYTMVIRQGDQRDTQNVRVVAYCAPKPPR